jgi:hypothetical protein
VRHVLVHSPLALPLCVGALLLACGEPAPAPGVAPLASTARTVDAGAQEAATPATPEAEGLFLALLPDLQNACGGCHAQGTLAPLWLAPPDPYASIKGYDGVVTPDPTVSKLLVKGRHSGPAMGESLRERVAAWLAAEARGLAATAPLSTGPVTLSQGPNVIALSRVHGAPEGAALTFTAQWTTSAARLKLAELTVVAPTRAGVRVVHPTFGAARAGAFVRDPIDGFSSVDQTIAAGQSASLGDGMLFLEGWQIGDALEIRFEGLSLVSSL